MKKNSLLLKGIFLLVSVVFFVVAARAEKLSPRYTNYKIKAKLNPETKIVNGEMWLTWKNPSTDTVATMQFHMYLNAFKNTESTFYKESGGQLRGMSKNDNDSLTWGYVDVLSMIDDSGVDLASEIKFIHPDDDNIYDQTVIEVPLNRPVLPGDSIHLHINFVSKLPEIFARSGYSGNYFLVAQWFPKPGVYEPAGMRYATKGQWNCHQYHGHSEFYANFSNYDVEITVPEGYVVGSTGALQNVKDNGDSTVTQIYFANDVVDFAWTTSPRFEVVEDMWNDVKIMVYLQPEHRQFAARYISSLKIALEYFSKHLGKYPYSTITVVDPPISGSGSGGMEYPTFITGGSVWGLPDEVRIIEMVTIHEFGHNYFMGILASNEFEEAFIDEGFNTYYEGRIMDAAYGDSTSFIGFRYFYFGDRAMQRLGYTGMKNPKIAEVYRYAWQFPHGGYSSLSYNKTATWLMTLEGLVGIETMDEIMKIFYDRWKFKHPCARDFIEIVNEVVTKNLGDKYGENMNWFFDEVLYGSDVCDYKLASIKNKRVRKPKGLFDTIVEKPDTSATGKKLYESKVILHRLGEVIMPVEVLVHFDNGDEVLEHWDGKERTKEFSYKRSEKIMWAQIDPSEKIKIDVNMLNNGMTLEPERNVARKYMVRFLFVLQSIIQTLFFFA
ncbi:MAG: M1 family metallopeptidase [Chlorobi bacterium]|nr:M1 family metallopeptidase [Chlorobiota bacterium]